MIAFLCDRGSSRLQKKKHAKRATHVTREARGAAGTKKQKMTVLTECEVILSQQPNADDQKTDIKRKALDRLAVLSRFAKTTCELAVQGADGDAVRAYTLACHINALIDGVDSMHRLLRQAVPETDGIVKQMTEVKKGAFRNLSYDVNSSIEYSLPVSWACVPAMRVIVQVLKDLQKVAEE